MPEATVKRYSPTLDDFVEAYERAHAEHGDVDLGAFLPPTDHPLHTLVLRELIRVEIEYSWQSGRPRRLRDYQRRFPELFRDLAAVRDIAFEEYRQRRQAGEQPSAADYAAAFGVDPASWRGVPGGGTDGEVRLTECATSLPKVGSNFLGFHLLAELGRGGLGRVFLASQENLAGRRVVLKVSTDPGGEPHALARLQHTNIVPIHSVHRAGSLHAVCMPYFGATTLADVLRELRGRQAIPGSGLGLVSTLHGRKSKTQPPAADDPPALPEPAPADEPPVERTCTATLEMLGRYSYAEAVLWLGARLADGLAHAHERGILHRDLKPANVLLTDEGQPMLLDFNLSADTRHAAGVGRVVAGGTLPYMAPEHREAFEGGARPVDERSDLYSLGILLFELLTLRHPFEDRGSRIEDRGSRIEDRGSKTEKPRSEGEAVRAIFDPRFSILDPRSSPPGLRRWNPTVSPAVESIVRHCLEPEPARRYPSARALHEDLQRQLAHLPLRYAPEPSPRERLRKWLRRHPRLASWSTGVLVVGVVLAALLAGLACYRARLNSLEAEAACRRLHEDSRAVAFLLSVRHGPAGARQDGEARCRAALAPYRVLDDPAWQSAARVRWLPAEERERLRGTVGELLLMLARGSVLDALERTDEAGRADGLREARRLNGLAEDCFNAGQVPRALWEQRAECAGRLGAADEARAAQRRAEQAPPRTARDHYLAAVAAVDAGHIREARDLLERATRLDPQDFRSWFTLGYCCDRLAQDREAAAHYTTALALWPGAYWRVYLNRGLAYCRLRDFARAREDLDQAVALAPREPDGYINRALAFQGLRDYDRAAADLTVAIEELKCPETRLYFLRARVWELAGQPERAKEDRERGLSAEPADALSWLARGAARLKTDLDGALHDFDEALRLDRRSLAALQNRAHVLAKKRGGPEETRHWLEDAVATLDRAVAWYPDYVPARSGRGVLLARLGRREAALRDAAEAVRLDPQPAILYQVAGIHARTASAEHPEDRAEARRLLATALRQGFGFDLLEEDRDLDPIRADPEFRRLVEAARAVRAAPAGRP